MPNFDNDCIYKIQCKDPSVKDIYIGSTCRFNKRKIEHKSRYNRGLDYEVYRFIKANGGWDNWDMVKIKDIADCLDRHTIKQHEREFIDQLKPKLNTTTPNRTTDDWRKDNADRVRQKGKEATRRYRARKKLISLQS